MKAHLLEQVSLYGEQILVNLVNQKGHERPIKEAYERFIAQVCHLTRAMHLRIHATLLAPPLQSAIRILRFS